jgi:hypothetical protein
LVEALEGALFAFLEETSSEFASVRPIHNAQKEARTKATKPQRIKGLDINSIPHRLTTDFRHLTVASSKNNYGKH